MDFYHALTLLIVATAIFSYINYRFIKLPGTIGVMIISLVFSVILVSAAALLPHISNYAVSTVRNIDFADLLMEVMLSFLLFAGAIHVDIGKLRKEKTTIITYASLGVLLSTAITGVLMYFLFAFFNVNIELIYCLLFGALISPTDPIAVLGILKNANIPPSLETKITGESLFNDGVGVVVFLSILEVARIGVENMAWSDIMLLFVREAGGGILWGALIGYIGFLLLKSIDNYRVEVLITLAMVMGGYAFASAIHISGPLSMVVAGIITGNRGRKLAMSDITRDYLTKFWEILDEVLNALLFLLIGFEMLVIVFRQEVLWIGLLSIGVVILARWISVLVPTIIISFRKTFEKNAIAMLTWGGLRGGISVALALAIPVDMHRDLFVQITYIVVIFSIVVQGLTIGKFARRLKISTDVSQHS